MDFFKKTRTKLNVAYNIGMAKKIAVNLPSHVTIIPSETTYDNFFLIHADHASGLTVSSKPFKAADAQDHVDKLNRIIEFANGVLNDV